MANSFLFHLNESLVLLVCASWTVRQSLSLHPTQSWASGTVLAETGGKQVPNRKGRERRKETRRLASRPWRSLGEAGTRSSTSPALGPPPHSVLSPVPRSRQVLDQWSFLLLLKAMLASCPPSQVPSFPSPSLTVGQDSVLWTNQSSRSRWPEERRLTSTLCRQNSAGGRGCCRGAQTGRAASAVRAAPWLQRLWVRWLH